MKTIYILIPALIIAIHLLALKKRMSLVKSFTKVLIIPYIFLCFLVIIESFGRSLEFVNLLISALALYTAGDLLLEFRSGKAFIIGGLLFSLGHVLYALFFLLHGFSIPAAVLFAGIYILLYAALFSPHLKKESKDTTAYVAYAIFVMFLGVAAGSADFAGNWIAKTSAVFGALSYAFSDALVIIRQTSDKDDAKALLNDDLLIMVTYIGANILLLSSITLYTVMA